MLDMGVPPGDVLDHGTEPVVDAHILAEDVASPTVVVAGNHQHLYAGVDHVAECGHGPKRASRNDRAPLEPELEEIAVHDERTGVLGDVAQKGDDGALDVGAGEAQVGVGEDVAGRLQHARILPVSRSLYKQTMLDDLRDVTNDAAAPRVVTPPGGALPPHDIQFRVRYAETDQMGVVYHANYLIWCEVGRTDFIRARGMSYADIERSGVGLAVSDLEARFHGAARYDDLIRVRTTLAEVRSRSITFDYVITNAETNERLVSASTTLVSIDKNGRPVAIPPAVRALFHPHPHPSHALHHPTQPPSENR